MSFSATILFTPPGRGEGGEDQPAPIEVSGGGLAVPGPDQLLHLIYQRLQALAATADEALALARANQRLLRGLDLQLRSLAGAGPLPCPPPSPYSPPAAPTLLPGAPGGVPPLRVIKRQPDAEGQVCDPSDPAPSPERRVSPSPSPPVGLRAAGLSLGPELGAGSGSQADGSEDSSTSNLLLMEDLFHSALPGLPLAHRGTVRGYGTKNTRRKRDVVLSKMVHNIHNHVSNEKRFNGAESIKSSWNMGVVKFLLERLKGQLMVSPHLYADKELKGACVAYFLTKRREYRNTMNPYKSLKEREEKKLRSRRYRLFAARTAMVRLFSPEDQRLWEGASEELMSDEEDSPLEPGVWVARSPGFRCPRLTDLCRRLDANSRRNRVPGPPSDRLPSAPEPNLYPPRPPPYVEVKVEDDD